MSPDLPSELRQVLRAEQVRTEPLELALYGRDASLMSGQTVVACLPETPDEVAAIVEVCARHGRPFVARGSGTGLAGGAVPVGDPVVIVTTRLNRILEVDLDNGVAWVEPGVLNLDLSRALAAHGVLFAPDPSSQQVCSIGGNVANNSGGPHCLAYGVTTAHVVALDVVLPDGTMARLGALDPEPPGYDLRGVFVGSEGTLGVAVRIAVRLTPVPPAVATLLVDYADVGAGAATVSGIIAAGLVPAALEMMDRPAIQMVEAFVHAGYPTDAAAVLLVELDGLPAGVAAAVEEVRRIATDNGARTVRVAADEAERALLWKGRKNAFGAVARIRPDYYLHDTVVPRTRLVEVLDEVYRITARYDLVVVNVFHAGDGNLHPILAFDGSEPGVLERVQQAGREIVEASLAAGGVLSGEHGIGLEKRDYMPLMFSAADLAAQDRLRSVFDPDNLANPTKVIPDGSRCGDLAGLRPAPEGAWA
jgi:glycolate oxidase